MNSLPSLFETISEFTPTDFINVIIQSYYYPVYYTLHAIFVCLNIRYSAKPGLKWYRSFILGYVMTAGPRYVYGKLVSRLLIEFEHMNALRIFAIVWALFNICPFDLVFKLANRKSIRIAIQILDSFSQIQNIVGSVYHGLVIYQGQPLTVGTIVMFCMCIPLIADVVDRIFIGQRFFPMAYQFNYVKRVLIFICIAILDLYLVQFAGVQAFEMPELSLMLSALFVLFSIVDVTTLNGRIFYTRDFFFPKFMTEFVNYWPAHEQAEKEAIKEKIEKEEKNEKQAHEEKKEVIEEQKESKTSDVLPPPPKKQQKRKGQK